MISKLALARVDLNRYQMSCEIQENWMPRVLGSMMLRPGTWFRGTTYQNRKAIHIPFIFSTSDFAHIEQTEGNMRVRIDDEIIERQGVDTAITNGDFATGDAFTAWPKIADPASMPSTSTFIKFSPDGTVMVTSTGTGACYYSISEGTFTFQGSFVGTTSGALNGAFSPAGNLFVLRTLTEVLAYTVSGSGASVSFTPITPPPGALAGFGGGGVAFSPNGAFLSICAGVSPYIKNYAVSGTSFTALADPGTLPTGIAQDVTYSPDGALCVVAHSTTPFISIYSITGTGSTAIFTKVSNPATLPASTGRGVAFSPSANLMAVAHATTPFVTVYSYSGTVFTKLTDPATLPAAEGFSAAFNPTGEFLAIAHTTTPFVTIYSVGGTVLTKIPNPTTLPSDDSVDAVFDPSGKYLVVASNSDTPTFSIYEVQTLWANLDGPGSTSTISNGSLSLVGTGFTTARRVQAVYVSNADKATEHGIRIIVSKGYVTLRIGTTFDGSNLIAETTLRPGIHSLSFAPNSNVFYIDVSANTQYSTVIDSIEIEAAGEMILPTIWAENDLPYLRWAQSADVVFIDCKGKKPQQIERRSKKSWSIVDYLADNGPFRNINSTGITMTPGSLTGDTTLTASQNFFNAGHVGALFKLVSIGQTVSTSFTGDNQFANPIKVTGTGGSRSFTVTRSGTWSATITLQRSVSDTNSWADVQTWTTNGTSTITDGFDNQIIYYRLAVKSGNYTSGTADTVTSYASGGLIGVARVTGFVNNTVVNVSVLAPFGATTATATWYEGAWSAYRGYPSANALYEGRLWHAGKERIYGSVSDAFNSFDDQVTGDSGPINRSIGEGPVDTINWLMPIQRMILGTEGSEKSARSTSFDEPLSPTNFNLKDCSTQGSGAVAAVKIDSDGVFVQRSGMGVYRLSFDTQSYDYGASRLTDMVPEVTDPGVLRMAVQRQPDTRIHCILADGTAAVMVFDQTENVTCWVKIVTDGASGEIEDVSVLPGLGEDTVYYTVKRTINGETVRYLERFALESECVGHTVTKCIDSHFLYSGDPTTIITGLDHLEGEHVVVWADGKDMGMDPDAPQNTSDTFMVNSGQIELPEPVREAVIGLYYEGPVKSAKLYMAAAQGSALNRRKRLTRAGLIMANAHAQGLKIGTDFDHLRSLPRDEGGKIIDPNFIWDHYDFDLMSLNSEWNTDNRLCLLAASPRPVTLLAATIDVETNG